MLAAVLLLAIPGFPPTQKGKPTLEEMIERVRREADLVPDDLLHEIAVWQNAVALEALGEFYGLFSTAAKRRQVVHEYRHFAKTALAEKALARLEGLGLAATDTDEGREAAGSLAEFGAAGAPALRRIAREGGGFLVRGEAVAKLAPHRTEEDFPLFLEVAVAADAPPALRASAIRAIGPDPRADGITRRALSDPAAIVRGSALLARASLRDPAAMAVARTFAADPKMKEWTPCMGAIAVLREGRGAETARLLFAIGVRTTGGVRAAAHLALRDFDPLAAAGAALEAFAAEDRAAALFGVEVLHGLKHADAGRALRRLLGSPDPEVVAAAATALGALGEAEAVADLRKETSNPDPRARAAVVEALSDLLPNDRDWRRRLLQFADDPDLEVRVAAVLSLGEHGGAEILPALERMLSDREGAVRAAAIEGLALARRKEAVPILIARLKKEKGRFREDLASALRRITGQAFGREAGDWERWWVGEGERFVVPPVGEVEAKAKALAKARAEATTASFYGIEVLSDRAVFVLDASGSMAERTGTASPGGRAESRYQVALRELRNALEPRLREKGAKFNLVLFSGDPDAWHEKMQPLEPGAVERAIGFAENRRPAGGTNLHGALARVFEDPEVDSVYLLSDGEPSAGPITDAALLRTEVKGWNRFRRVAIHAVSIGTASALLEGLAADSGGRFVKR